MFPSYNRTDKIQFLKQYCDLRLLIDTEDLHPTHKRFKPIAQQCIENIFLCICNQQYPDVLRVASKINIISTPTDNSHDSDFSDYSDSDSGESSGNELSEQDTLVDEIVSDNFYPQLRFQGQGAGDSDISIEYERSHRSSPVVFPSASTTGGPIRETRLQETELSSQFEILQTFISASAICQPMEILYGFLIADISFDLSPNNVFGMLLNVSTIYVTTVTHVQN